MSNTPSRKIKKPSNLNQFQVNLASESSFCVFAFLAVWRKSFESFRLDAKKNNVSADVKKIGSFGFQPE
jgi:hypothetical protein